jgi:prepilin-type N-terminal cleavage/methylation domain-containing protein
LRNHRREQGFTFIELLVTMTIMLVVTGAALTTFKNALDINETASQLADSSQNLRAGTNQLVRDLMMAGRIIAGRGVPAPNGSGSLTIMRPGPPGSTLTFNFVADEDGTLNLPSLTTGYQLGPTINGSQTDIVTILTVDEFMPMIQGLGTGTPTGLQGRIATDGSNVTLPTSSPWLMGDPTEDTPPIAVGDIVLFKNENGMALQTVTSKDTTKIYFAQANTNDWFRFNQRSTALKGTVFCIKENPTDSTKLGCDTMPVSSTIVSANFPTTALFRLLMITYYVDNTTLPGTPRLTRMVNHFTPQALAGVVEDFDLTFDLVNPTLSSVTSISSLPFADASSGVIYTSHMIKKVNIHMGVRSEALSKPSQDFVRSHISTSVDVRSLASVDRYDTSP